jgi:hypothetical protein
MAVFFNDSAFFVFSIFIMCSTRFVLYYIPYKRKVFTFFKKGNNVLRKPVRPSLLYSFEKNQKGKKNMFSLKTPSCMGGKPRALYSERHLKFKMAACGKRINGLPPSSFAFSFHSTHLYSSAGASD